MFQNSLRCIARHVANGAVSAVENNNFIACAHLRVAITNLADTDKLDW